MIQTESGRSELANGHVSLFRMAGITIKDEHDLDLLDALKKAAAFMQAKIIP